MGDVFIRPQRISHIGRTHSTRSLCELECMLIYGRPM